MYSEPKYGDLNGVHEAGLAGSTIMTSAGTMEYFDAIVSNLICN